MPYVLDVSYVLASFWTMLLFSTALALLGKVGHLAIISAKKVTAVSFTPIETGARATLNYFQNLLGGFKAVE